MANNIFWGKIYEFTNWGKGITNNISWGKVYADLAGAIPSFALDFAKIGTDFTFTRSSFATRVNEQGLIETVTDLSSELVANGDFDELGSELVTNGTFDTDSNWNLNPTSGTAVISDGTLNFTDSTSTGAQVQQQSIGYVVGKTYKVTFTISNYVKGNFALSVGNQRGTFYNSNGTFTDYITYLSGLDRSYLYTTDSTLSVDNISVKQVDPNDEWTFSNVGGDKGWRIVDGRAICDTVNPLSGRNLQSTTVLTSGKTYKLTLDILQSADNIQLTIGATALPVKLPTGTNLGYEYIINGADHTGGPVTFFAGTSDLQEVDNISIKEVFEDDVPRIDYTNSTFNDVLGSQLITNRDFATDSGWVKGASWSISNGKASSDGSVNSFLTQNSVIQGGKQYSVSFKITDLTAGAVQLRLGSGATVTKSYNTNQVVSEYFTSDGTNLNFYSVNGFNGSIDNVSVKEVTGEIATDEGEFLLEPTSTNLIPYSEDFSDSNWLKSGDTTIESGYLAPDGTLTAYKASGTSSALQYNSITNTTDTRTIYARTVSGTATANLCSFNQNTNNEFTITEDWQRFEVNGTTSSSGATAFYAVDFRGSTTLTEIILWGAQVEALPYATSYIPTLSGSAVTRAGELCVDATPTINSEEGTLYVEASTLVNGGGNRYISLSDGTSSNRVQLLFSSATNRLSINCAVGGTGTSGITYTSFVQTDNHKIAFKYSSDGVKLFVDGVERGSHTDNVSYPIGTLTDLDFSLWNSLSYPFYGRTKDLKIYTEALTDEQLEELTTI